MQRKILRQSCILGKLLGWRTSECAKRGRDPFIAGSPTAPLLGFRPVIWGPLGPTAPCCPQSSFCLASDVTPHPTTYSMIVFGGSFEQEVPFFPCHNKHKRPTELDSFSAGTYSQNKSHRICDLSPRKVVSKDKMSPQKNLDVSLKKQ